MRQLLVIQIVTAIIAIVMAACGHSDTFVVNGTIEGNPTMNIRVIYTMRGQVYTGVTAATDGKFSFKAAAPDTAIVELYDNDYALLGRFLTINGEDINLSLSRSPYRLTVEGNEIAQRWATFLSENADALQADDARHNAVIAKYIEANPADEVSTLLLITEYNVALSDSAAVQAQQLWQTVQWKPVGLTSAFAMQLNAAADTAAHAAVDSLRYLRSGNTHAVFVAADHPLTLITISSERDGRDSTLAMLRRIKAKGGRLADGRAVYVLDLSIDTDTLEWSRSLRRDSATWQRGWLHGGIAHPALRALSIPSVPYYILLDSAGTQLRRSPAPF
ncbi:MAG: DUF4369 domain-containing protein [Muribaculaceae bacterium]